MIEYVCYNAFLVTDVSQDLGRLQIIVLAIRNQILKKDQRFAVI